MNRRLTWMAAVAFGCMATALQAAPIFYLSEQPVGVAAPGIMNLNVDEGAVGSFGIYATSDVRLSGVSLDITEVGGGIKFTGVAVQNPSNRWTFLDGPLTIADSQIKSMGGGAIPFVSGNGIGGASPEIANVPSGYLIAAVNYMALGGGLGSNLFIKVGSNLIADFDGASPAVVFGPGSPPTPGDVPGASDNLFDGRINVNSSNLPPVVGDLGPLLGDMSSNGIGVPTPVSGTLPATDDGGVSALSWMFDGPSTGPGVLAQAPTLDPATGLFSWDVDGSKGGLYTFPIKATDAGGLSDGGLLTVEVRVPEPASLALVSLALVGLVGLARRK